MPLMTDREDLSMKYNLFVLQIDCTTSYVGYYDAMMIGRTEELAVLHKAWRKAQSGSAQMAVVWGRRRVGKTFLISSFTAGLPCVFFTATRNLGEREQLDRLFEAGKRSLGARMDLAGGGFLSLDAALRFYFQVSVSSPLVLVMDEVPRLGKSVESLGDVFAAVWDQRPADAKLFLVLCGSAVSAMRDLLGPNGGLYRRADPELRIDPLDPWSASKLLGPHVDGETVIQAYATCGGYPLHLAAWDTRRSVAQNVFALAGSPGSLLLRDALDIMFEDLDFRSGYERVLGTMALGPTRRSKIASRAQQRIDQTLKQLQRSGYVSAERPIGAPVTADPLYRITDPYLRFWFSVLRVEADLIDGGQGHVVLKRVAPLLETHVQSVFEDVARMHAVREIAAQRLPECVIGRWWKDEVLEADVVGLTSNNQLALLGEAKWQTKSFSLRQLAELRAKAPAIAQPRARCQFAVWARRGAAGAVRAFPDVRTYSPDQMFGADRR
jgi:AAA+ ATPase superfamily predicted ATPase